MTTQRQQQRWRRWRPNPRQEQALALRAQGLPYRAIGAALGVSTARARALVVETRRRLDWQAAHQARTPDGWAAHAAMLAGVP